MIKNLSGPRFPLRFVNGRLSLSSGAEHVRHSVEQILSTRRGEYPLKPSFGCDLPKRVFGVHNVQALASLDVREALSQEPRAELVEVAAEYSGADKGGVGVVTVRARLRIAEEQSESDVEIQI